MRRVIWMTVVGLMISAQAWSGDAVVRGTLSLSDGDVKEGKIIYRKAWKASDKVKRVTVETTGRFEITVPDPDQYIFIFTHPDYQPFTVYGVDLFREPVQNLAVTLDRVKQPDAEDAAWSALLEEDNFKKKHPMTLENGVYTATLTTDQDQVGYMLDKGGSVINGPGPYSGVSKGGRYISTAKAVDGSVTIQANPSRITFREGPSQENLEDVGDVSVTAVNWGMIKVWRANGKAAQTLYGEGRPDFTGAAPILEYVMEAMEKLDDKQQVAFAAEWRFLSRFMNDLDQTNHTLEMISKNPDDLSWIPVETALSLHYQQKKNPFANHESLEQFLTNYQKGLPEGNQVDFLLNLARFREFDKDLDGARAAYGEMLEKYPESSMARFAGDRLKQLAMVGQPAPSFTMNNQNDEPVSLSDFKGKYVLLDMWATWCGPCIAEVPTLIRNYERVDKSKIEFVSVCLDAQSKKLAKFTESKKMTWTQLGTSGNFDAEIAKTYSISFLPNVFLIGPDGKVILQNDGLRGEALAATLARYLGDGDGGGQAED